MATEDTKITIRPVRKFASIDDFRSGSLSLSPEQALEHLDSLGEAVEFTVPFQPVECDYILRFINKAAFERFLDNIEQEAKAGNIETEVRPKFSHNRERE